MQMKLLKREKLMTIIVINNAELLVERIDKDTFVVSTNGIIMTPVEVKLPIGERLVIPLKATLAETNMKEEAPTLQLARVKLSNVAKFPKRKNNE